jgi:hypothetical protein
MGGDMAGTDGEMEDGIWGGKEMVYVYIRPFRPPASRSRAENK